MALQFGEVRYRANNPRIEVLKVDIEFDEDNLLDFNDKDTVEFFSIFVKKHNNERMRLQSELNKQKNSKRQNYDGIMIEMFIKTLSKEFGREVEAVQKDTYTKLVNLPFISNFSNGRELCVRKANCIKKSKKVISDGYEFKRFL